MTSTAQDTTTASGPVPTSPDELYALLSTTPWHERDQIRARLAAQLGDQGDAWRLFDNADSLVRRRM